MKRLLRFSAGVVATSLFCGCEWTGQPLDAVLEEAGSMPTAAIGGLFTLGTFFSEDVTCVSAGVLVSRGVVPYWLAAACCMLGVWLSDMGLYGVGALGRRGLLDRAPLRWIVSRERLEKGSRLFTRHGAKMIVLSRFLPGSRVPLYVSAGFLSYPFCRYAAWMALASVLWTPLMVFLAMKLGDALMNWLSVYEKTAWLVVIAVILCVWGVTRGLEYIASRRLRRLMETEPDE